jgi:lysyl-tRNA synthetase class 1
LQATLPARAQELSATQRGFLHILAGLLPRTKWEGDALQVCIFSAARLTPIEQPSAFKAIYRVLLDRENGPKAGNFLSFLERDFVVRRCLELPVDKRRFWQETGLSEEAFAQWLVKEKPNLTALSAKLDLGFIEILAAMADGKTYCKRVSLEGEARPWLDHIENQAGLKISVSTI